MPNPATVADLVSRWRPLTPQEETNGSTFLADAWGLLTRTLAAQSVDLEDAMASDASLAPEVVRVIATAVLRVLKNPDGLSGERVDDYSYTRDEAVASGLLYFTDAELHGLAPGSGGAKVFSVSMLSGWSAQWES